jgi:hypothetical protein
MSYILSCEVDKNHLFTSNGDFSEAQFDIQQECNGKYILIQLNEKNILESFLSDHVPLEGPLASFNIDIEKGLNRISVKWHSLNSSYIIYEDSADIFIGEFEKYYIGIDTPQDSLVITVQSQPFLYI